MDADQYLALREEHVVAYANALGEFFGDLATTVTSMAEVNPDAIVVGEVFDLFRWNAVLRALVYLLNRTTSVSFGNVVAGEFGGVLDPEGLDAFLLVNAERSAENINLMTVDHVQQALVSSERAADLGAVFASLTGERTERYSQSMPTMAANFGMMKAAEQNGGTRKTWRVNSKNPRSSHAALNGASVPVDGVFANGMRWPGDPSGGAKQNANCRCSLTYARG